MWAADGINWTAATISGGFIAGAVLATVAVLKLLQIVHKIERKNRDQEKE